MPELKSIKEKPEEETNELRQILAEKGFKGELLDRIVDADAKAMPVTKIVLDIFGAVLQGGDNLG